jgi:hypothetical protein
MQTPSRSCGLVHGHGVLVTMPVIQAFGYFEEMMRVCTPRGYVVFDFYSDRHFDTTVIGRWLASPHRYPVIMPQGTVLQYFNERNFRLVHAFENKHGVSQSQYVIFTNNA